MRLKTMAAVAWAAAGGTGCSISSLFDSEGATGAQTRSAPASASQLTAGRAVRIRLSGSAAPRIASSVHIEPLGSAKEEGGVRGPIGSVDVAGNGFTVLGLRVRVSDSTRLDGAASVADLGVGQEVDVRGTVDLTGALAASDVRVRVPEVRGVIESSSALAGGGAALSVLGQPIAVPGSAPVTVDQREYQSPARGPSQR